jgi:protein TonB
VTHIVPPIIAGHDLIESPELPTLDLDVTTNSEALRRFLTTVRRKIESEKKYPVIARNTGIEGRVGVIISILKDGQLEKAEVLESSGYEVLDKAALGSVRNASPFPAIPKESKRDKLELRVYLVFELSRR